MVYDFSTIMQFVTGGLIMGLVYSLIALGFTVIFNASGILNFAQGAFVMMGGMATYMLFQQGLPLYLAALAAILLTVAAAVGIYLVVISPIQRRKGGPDILIMSLFGAHIVMENAALLIAGPNSVGYPAFVSGPPLRLGDVTFSRSLLAIGLGAVVVMVILNIFFFRTRAGIAMRAAAINRTAARLVGIRVEYMVLMAFAISAALGAIAGVLVTPAQSTAFNVGMPLVIKGFAAAIIGGFGNISGAMAGGVIIGLVESLGVAFVSAQFKEALPFVVLLIILLTRPQGLLPSLVEEEEV